MRAPLLLLLAMASASPLMAQRRPARRPAPVDTVAKGRPCILDVDSIPRFVQSGTNYYGGGGVAMHCREQPTTMTADSLSWYSAISELHLTGNVHFRDSTAILDSDNLVYWVKLERVYATGRVYTRNLASGSDLRGPNIDYYRAAANVRDTVELIATGRPTMHFFPSPDTASADTTPADTTRPFIVVGDRVRMRGNERMWGGGNVTIDRDALHARGDSAGLDLIANRGWLIGNPMVSDTGGTSYRLRGRRIVFDLTDDNEIRRVLAQDSANADGPDWRLAADTLDIAVDSGAIQRAQAWGRRRRSTAVSDRNTITADSLDIHMPKQIVSLVWAYGSGRAVSTPDSTAPDSEPDWLSGDTLRANFRDRRDTTQRRPDAVRDTTQQRSQARSELEHITAFGSARAYYHVDNEQQRGGPRAISYARGRRIDIRLRESRVRTVDVVGQVDGIYLEPIPPGAARDSALAPDSLRTDTLRTRPLPAPRPRR